MKCLILAAGKGSRLRNKGDSKPLLPVLGVPLIERVIRNAMQGGADDFYIVTGNQKDKVTSFLNVLSKRLNVSIKTVENNEWANSENGTSIYKAKNYLTGPFLLLMSDHLFDPSIVKQLIASDLGEGEITLAVDENITNPIIDFEDVTRVRYDDGKIQNIGKELSSYNAFDTGIFYCTPAIFDALEKSSEKGDTSLSGAVRILAKNGKANVLGINGNFWIDIDDEKSLKKAEDALISQLRNKPNDGPVSRYLNRPLSIRISKLLVRFPITPNVISALSFLLSLFAAGLFAFGKNYISLLIGGLITHIASVIDGCDGEIARLKFMRSKYGGWFDAVLDRYADAFLLFGLTWHEYMINDGNLILIIGFMAIIGSFMLSYTADKYDNLMNERIASGGTWQIRIGRDVRLFIILIGAVLNQIFILLVIIAIVMNLETVRRIIVCKSDE
ncbi:MAG: NTP transferase domain-containing protein [Bacteroidetes bacterium]|nr:NTP transferase domain-containing protein [Bacteroidota bacterium]